MRSGFQGDLSLLTLAAGSGRQGGMFNAQFRKV